MPYLLRQFDAEKDHATVCSWWEDRGLNRLPIQVLPKLGVMAVPEEGAEPDAAAWLYMDNSTGVCFLEGTVTRPNLSLSDARAAVGAMVGFLKLRAREMGYGTMITFAGKALARESKRAGFVPVESDLVMLVANLMEETPCL